MANKPTVGAGYPPAAVQMVRAANLYIATKLGDLRDDVVFAAVITPGLELAFQDRRLLTLEGETLRHEQASREVWVCEAGAFTVLKALAFQGRGENKDAYDLIYTLQNYGAALPTCSNGCDLF